MPRRLVSWIGTCVVLGLAPGCANFRIPGPEDPAAQELPRSVSVTIEYRQPNGCQNALARCNDPVVFFGTWMRPGAEFRLSADPAGSHVWTGTAHGVPVNYPPRDAPYEVRIYDPHLQATPDLTRYTAHRLTVGREAITRIENPGGFNEHGLVYIDDNGHGRNPY